MSDPDAAELAIVVVSYGSSHLLRDNLASIDRASLPPSMVVVVDNHTTEAERQRVVALAEQHSWHLISPDANLGFAAGANLGVDRALEAGCRRALLLNPDVAIEAPTIMALVHAVDERPVTLVCPRLVLPDGSTWFAGAQLDRRIGLTPLQPDHAQDSPDRWLTGACLMVDRAAWELVGGFDERYFMYWEDVDLSQRALRRDAHLRILHEVAAVHSVGATQQTEGKSPIYCRYMCQNRLLFSVDHVAPAARLRWLLNTPAYALRMLRRAGWSAVRSRPSFVLGTIRGSATGIALVVRSLVADVIGRRSRPVPG